MRCRCKSYAVLLSRNRMRDAISLKARPKFHKPLYPSSSPDSTSNKNDEKEKNHVRY